MHQVPVVHFTEYAQYTTQETEANGIRLTERVHPDFGTWRERSINLGSIVVAEHQANLSREINVLFDDGSVKDYVHHCHSLKGTMGTYFRNQRIRTQLTPNTFHSLFVPEQGYLFSMTTAFTNIHIALAKEYYTGLLCDSEKWSAEMRTRLLNNLAHYTGELKLTPQMVQVIHSIFNSQLSGSLKKLLIEAQVQELVAMQLHTMLGNTEGRNSHTSKADVFYAIRDYLDATFLQEHTLKSIARNFGLNDFALKKGFRENFNSTVFEYLLNKRLEHGRELLLSSAQTIQQISTTVGYKYANHFSAAFKKKFGINPAQLR
jgi:AraC-like DNA-binding protein